MQVGIFSPLYIGLFFVSCGDYSQLVLCTNCLVQIDVYLLQFNNDVITRHVVVQGAPRLFYSRLRGSGQFQNVTLL